MQRDGTCPGTMSSASVRFSDKNGQKPSSYTALPPEFERRSTRLYSHTQKLSPRKAYSNFPPRSISQQYNPSDMGQTRSVQTSLFGHKSATSVIRGTTPKSAPKRFLATAGNFRLPKPYNEKNVSCVSLLRCSMSDQT